MRGVLPDEYRTVYIPKRKGGERRIDIPNEALLAQQRSILYRFLSKLSPSPFAHGFVEKRSPVTAAIPHVGKKIVVKIDIENFFNSINFAQWREVMMHRLMSFPSWHRVLCTIHRDARTRYRRGDRWIGFTISSSAIALSRAQSRKGHPFHPRAFGPRRRLCTSP
jgi:retron-type reverse transcriptase